MVTKLESGDKELTVEILMAIARIHDLPYSFYLDAMPGSANHAKGVYTISALSMSAA